MDSSFEIDIVFDDKCPKPGFLPSFGFSALIYNYFTEKFSLFDTGGNGNILIHNIEQLNVDVLTIKNIIISHNHHDHAGGLDKIIQINPNVEIYVPIAHLKSYLRRYSNYKVFGFSELKEIEKNFIISGEIKGNFISEQAVFLKTRDNELIILVGCSHPGVEQFILKAQEIGNIKAIMGGFHGFRKLSYLKNINFIGPCHCTQHLNLIKKTFPGQFRRICLGDHYLF